MEFMAFLFVKVIPILLILYGLFVCDLVLDNGATTKSLFEKLSWLKHPVVTLRELFCATKKGFIEDTQERRMETGKQRSGIIYDFSEKHDLHLTEEQIEEIVNASYVSEKWEAEIRAMDKEYASVLEWMSGESRFVRAYLYIFSIQEISADFERQKEIAVESFRQIFNEISWEENEDRTLLIRRLNKKYFTNFTEESLKIVECFVTKKHLVDEELETVKRDRKRQLDKLKKRGN